VDTELVSSIYGCLMQTTYCCWMPSCFCATADARRVDLPPVSSSRRTASASPWTTGESCLPSAINHDKHQLTTSQIHRTYCQTALEGTGEYLLEGTDVTKDDGILRYVDSYYYCFTVIAQDNLC